MHASNPNPSADGKEAKTAGSLGSRDTHQSVLLKRLALDSVGNPISENKDRIIDTKYQLQFCKDACTYTCVRLHTLKTLVDYHDFPTSPVGL